MSVALTVCPTCTRTYAPVVAAVSIHRHHRSRSSTNPQSFHCTCGSIVAININFHLSGRRGSVTQIRSVSNAESARYLRVRNPDPTTGSGRVVQEEEDIAAHLDPYWPYHHPYRNVRTVDNQAQQVGQDQQVQQQYSGAAQYFDHNAAAGGGYHYEDQPQPQEDPNAGYFYGGHAQGVSEYEVIRAQKDQHEKSKAVGDRAVEYIYGDMSRQEGAGDYVAGAMAGGYEAVATSEAGGAIADAGYCGGRIRQLYGGGNAEVASIRRCESTNGRHRRRTRIRRETVTEETVEYYY